MSNNLQPKLTYLKDVEMAASKSKFGYFSIPPPVSAGDQLFSQKKVLRDQNGKPKTQQRNIFSGLSASGVLKKSFFSYPQYIPGDQYLDPAKIDRLNQLQLSRTFAEKEKFKPASLSKTLINSAYPYIPLKQQAKDMKKYLTEDGRVKTQPPNISSCSASKLSFKSRTQLKYISEPYENVQLRRKQLQDDFKKRGEGAFRLGSIGGRCFATNRQNYAQSQHILKTIRKSLNISNDKQAQQQHDCSFRPAGNHFNDGIFSYPKYILNPANNQNDKKQITGRKQIQKDEQRKDPFKLIKQNKSSKPCPSISFSKMNLIRSLR